MFSVHDSWPNQPEEDASVWRYMDLARFLSLLDSRALYFSQASSMHDPWEGAYGPGPFPEGSFPHFVQEQGVRDSIYLSCWHLSEYESAAMWDIYQREGRGVAIRTTWAELKRSLKTPKVVTGGKVSYVDYASFEPTDLNVFAPFNYKRMSFRHEQEARLVYWSEGLAEDETVESIVQTRRPDKEPPKGVAIDVDLGSLVKKVYLAPDADAWLLPLLQRVTSKYGLGAEVVQSDLNDGPL